MTWATLKTLALVAVGVGAVGAFLAFIPGSPLWRLFHPPETVTQPRGEGRTLEIVTVLGKDAIPAIMDPAFVSGPEADEQIGPQALVIGLEVNGDARAYSTSHLNSHEVVNDTVGGMPVVVTW